MSRSKLFNPYGALRHPQPLGKKDPFGIGWDSEEANSQFCNTQPTPTYRYDNSAYDVKPPKGEK